jgi:hypothetical protein
MTGNPRMMSMRAPSVTSSRSKMQINARVGTNFNSLPGSWPWMMPLTMSTSEMTSSSAIKNTVRAHVKKWLIKSISAFKGFMSFHILSTPNETAQKWASLAPPLKTLE